MLARSPRRLAFVVTLLAFAGLAGPARAHEGHDHGAPVAAPVADASPRVEAQSPEFELLGTVRGGRLRLHLDRWATNEPVRGATVAVDGPGGSVEATPELDGSYSVAGDWLAKPGRHDLTFSITAGDTADLLAATLVVPAPATAAAVEATPLLTVLRANPALWAVGAGLALLGLLLGRLAAPRAAPPEVEDDAVEAAPEPAAPPAGPVVLPRRVAALTLAALMFAGTPASKVHAHEGEDHGAPPAGAPAPSDQPRRLADGTVFLPKPSQRLLEVRTVVTAPGEARRTASIPGLFSADPSRSGRVQASAPGRYTPPAGGVPLVGQRVTRGQVLGEIEPVATSLERGTLLSQIAEIDSSIQVTQSRLDRLLRLQGSVAQREIDEARLTVDGLKLRRERLAPVLERREALRASADGVLSAANVVPGQVVEGRESLFEIVDPASVWVDALTFDPVLARSITGGVGVTDAGARLALELVGVAPSAQQQAIPIKFRVKDPSPDLALGRPLTVEVETRDVVRGVILPAASLVRAPNGESIVFEHVRAETFTPRSIRSEPVGGSRVVVPAGLDAGLRIVTEGATLINQIR